jgi:hypothetical protein
MCSQCNNAPVTCVICRQEFRQTRGLHRHISQFHYGQRDSATRAQINQKIKQRELIPDGLGYLEKLFVHDDKKHVSTESISKFAEHLKTISGYKRVSHHQQIINRAKLQALKEDKEGTTRVTLEVPNKYLLPAYQVWEISGAAPLLVYLAFSAYGISHVAHELRKYPTFPEVPTDPGQKLRKDEQVSVPRVKKEEKVNDEVPEAATPVKKQRFF